jgi:peptide-methionine (S)-S-oxide reductase
MNLFKIGPLLTSRNAAPIAALGGLAILLAGCATLNAAPTQSSAKKDTSRRNKAVQPIKTPAGKEVAILAGGCFWCTEAIFTEIKGVDKVESGYAGGSKVSPTYEDVCSGTTGHAEAIEVTFDPKVVSYHDLLMIFLSTHDPTTLNQQGADRGTQYRSAIFYHTPQQKEAAEKAIKEVEAKHIWPNRIVTEVTAYTNFYPAEDYHKNYFARNGQQPYCQVVIAPKVAKFRQHYREKLKK